MQLGSARPGRRVPWSLRTFGVMALLGTLGCTACATLLESLQPPPAGSSDPAWSEDRDNPIIRIGQSVEHLLWNDPSVLREGSGYRMWLSGGDPRNLDRIVVAVYAADSADGEAWRIGSEPVLSPSSDPGAWDSLRIETPSVTRGDGTYHMYYSGADARGAKEGIFAIGHATSPDGRRWTRDPANPVVTPQDRDKHRWGYRGVGEPGVVYNPKDGRFYLYYVSMRFSRADPTIGHIGILLARSRDGSRYEHHRDRSGERALILTRDIPDATPGAWFGYSTPSATIDADGRFHLFCAFIVAPGGPATARHVTIVHAVSDDGLAFEVLDENVFEAGKGDWKDDQVRSPTAVTMPGGGFEMWFAGETKKPFFSAGIGVARRRP